MVIAGKNGVCAVMMRMVGNRKLWLLIALLAVALGAAAYGGTFSSQVSYTGEETGIADDTSYQVAVEFLHSNNYNASNIKYSDLLASAAFTDASSFCPNRTEIIYLKLTNQEAFPINYSLALKVKENGFGDALTYAVISGQDLLADQKKAHPANWAAYLLMADAAPSVLSVTGEDQAHPVADKVLLEPGGVSHLAVAVHMDENAGNEYQDKKLNMQFAVRFDADYQPGTVISGN